MGPPKHTVQIRQHGGEIGVILNSHASSAAPRRGISFFSEPQFREAVPHRRDTRQLPSQRTRPFGLDHLTTRRELWSGRNGCSYDKFILRARGTDFSSESYVGVAKGHMLSLGRSALDYGTSTVSILDLVPARVLQAGITVQPHKKAESPLETRYSGDGLSIVQRVLRSLIAADRATTISGHYIFMYERSTLDSGS